MFERNFVRLNFVLEPYRVVTPGKYAEAEPVYEWSHALRERVLVVTPLISNLCIAILLKKVCQGRSSVTANPSHCRECTILTIRKWLQTSTTGRVVEN